MLARGEDYAFARPSLTAQKLRRLDCVIENKSTGR
jgi:hypothetical protein